MVADQESDFLEKMGIYWQKRTFQADRLGRGVGRGSAFLVHLETVHLFTTTIIADAVTTLHVL